MKAHEALHTALSKMAVQLNSISSIADSIPETARTFSIVAVGTADDRVLFVKQPGEEVGKRPEAVLALTMLNAMLGAVQDEQVALLVKKSIACLNSAVMLEEGLFHTTNLIH